MPLPPNSAEFADRTPPEPVSEIDREVFGWISSTLAFIAEQPGGWCALDVLVTGLKTCVEHLAPESAHGERHRFISQLMAGDQITYTLGANGRGGYALGESGKAFLAAHPPQTK